VVKEPFGIKSRTIVSKRVGTKGEEEHLNTLNSILQKYTRLTTPKKSKASPSKRAIQQT